MSNKDIVQFYFKRRADSDLYDCRCGKTRKQDAKRGHGNLMEHIRTSHKNFREEVNSYFPALPFSQPLPSDKTKRVYGWLDWVISAGLPFNFCDRESTKKYSNVDSISSKLLTEYVKKMVKKVECKVRESLPDKFGILTDGWSEMSTSTHFVGIFALYPNKEVKQEAPLLAFLPLYDEISLDSDSHINFIEFTLGVYGKDKKALQFLVSDNENLNKAIARKLSIPMIGCASHRLNLAIKKILASYSVEVDMIQKLMVRLPSLTLSTKLRTKTDLRPVLKNETRWASCYNMLSRFFHLKDRLR